MYWFFGYALIGLTVAAVAAWYEDPQPNPTGLSWEWLRVRPTLLGIFWPLIFAAGTLVAPAVAGTWIGLHLRKKKEAAIARYLERLPDVLNIPDEDLK